MSKVLQNIDVSDLRCRLLNWYDNSCRDLPWRAAHGSQANVYHVWLSEIMLQQTTVATVIPYFEKFTSLWPTLQDFAQSSLEQLRVAWQGLGYYRRVYNMHRCAVVIMQDYDGQFPTTSAGLLKLPGIGLYTAAAIAAIVYNEAIVPVDGNVLRVMARLYNVHTPLPTAVPELSRHAHSFAAPHRAGDCAQALMELGAIVCKPRQPHCDLCSLQSKCLGFKVGQPAKLPLRTAKIRRPVKYARAHFYFDSQQQAIAVRYRPEHGILAGMMEIPSSEWSLTWTPVSQPHIRIRHVFTHVELNVDVVVMTSIDEIPIDCQWIKVNQMANYPLPSLTQKIIKAGMQQLTDKNLLQLMV